MRLLIFSIFTATLLLAKLATNAQKANDPVNKKREKIKAEKVAFITRELDLTVEEAQDFWPVYNKYQNKLNKIQQEKNTFINKLNPNAGSTNAKEVRQACTRYIDAYTRISEVRKTYHQKFMQILPPAKVYRLYQTEIAFKRHLLDKIKQK